MRYNHGKGNVVKDREGRVMRIPTPEWIEDDWDRDLSYDRPDRPVDRPTCLLSGCDKISNFHALYRQMMEAYLKIGQIRDKELRECVWSRMRNGTINCSNKCKSKDGKIKIGNHTGGDRITLYVNNFNAKGEFSKRQGKDKYTFAEVILHEFAHSCGWSHETTGTSKSGVPIPYGNPLYDISLLSKINFHVS